MESYRHWIVLNLLPDLGRLRINRLIATFGSADVVFEADEAALRAVPGVGEMAARNILDWRSIVDADAELELVAKHGVSLACLHDEHYPVNLKRASTPPPLLYYKGDLQAVDEAAVAIIGCRKLSHYGREVAETLAAGLAEAGVTVVSGLAIGIDSVAHRACLEAGGRTFAVLGNGLSTIYPAQHKKLAAQVAESGAVISEVPMLDGPDAGSFPQRNALIAWLSQGTVVVEAGARSGTSITARYALDENRSVFAVPGDIMRVNSVGTNQLIQEGAKLVTCTRDILVELEPEMRRVLSGLPRLEDEDAPNVAPLPADLSELEQRICAVLEDGELPLDTLHEVLEADEEHAVPSPADTMAALLQLEVRGLIRQLPGKLFRRNR